MMPPGTLEQVVFRMDALHRLEALGVPVLNPPRAVEAAVDKYLALARLEAAGLPVPPTWVGESADEALDAFERLGGDVVVKPLFGSEGRGLVRVSDRELARRTFQTLERLGAVLYVQRFVRHPGHDLRAFVLGDRVLGAIRRQAPGGDWRTNVAVGGRRPRPRARRRGRAPGPPRGEGRRGEDGGGRPAARPRARRAGRPRGQRRPRLAGPGRRRPGSTWPRRSSLELPGRPPMTTPGLLAQVACLLEATARKPGNVHRLARLPGRRPLPRLPPQRRGDRRPARPGRRGRRRAGGARGGRGDAAGRRDEHEPRHDPPAGPARRASPRASRSARGSRVLGATTVDDARARLPGDPPGEARRARRRSTSRTSPTSRPSRSARRCGWPPTATWSPASMPTDYRRGLRPGPAGPAARARGRDGRWRRRSSPPTSTLLADTPDTLIARKRGGRRRRGGLARAAEVLSRLARSPATVARDFDAWLRADGHARNPGATADLDRRRLVRRPPGWDNRAAAARGAWPSILAGSRSAAIRRGARPPWPARATRSASPRITWSSARATSSPIDGDHCERIHGHNYRVAVEVEGDLDANHYVFDFIALRDLTRAIVDELDHRMLLPDREPADPRSRTTAPNWLARYRDRRWSFPEDECVLLPIANTTAELLADYIAGRLRDAFAAPRPADARA